MNTSPKKRKKINIFTAIMRSTTASLLFFLLLQVGLVAQPGPQPPFTVELEAVSTSQPLLGLHSFAFAQSGSRWLFAGGRTNGLHGFSTNDNFPKEYANSNLIVVDTATWQVYQSPVHVLGLQLADPLRATNMQYVHDGAYLYMIGGFGWDSTANGYRTFATLTALHLDSVIAAVMNSQPLAPHIRQLVDTNLRVCGGELAKLGADCYLLFGHDFSGRYSDPPIPSFTQRYTDQIRKFRIQDNGVAMQLSNYVAFTDTNNYHRRDLNVGPVVRPDGSFALAAYSGVFQKQVNWPFPEPILIDSTGGTVQTGFTQLLNNYTCGMVPVFDSVLGDMYTVFLGGMGWNTYAPSTNTWQFDSLVPFVSDIGVLTHYGNGQWAQSALPVRMPGLEGSNAKFIPLQSTPHYANEVLKLRALPGRTLVGYLYGGIRSLQPNLSPTTTAVDTVYRVYLTPDQVLLPASNGAPELAFVRLFPNPAGDRVCLRIKTNTETPLRITVTDVQGKQVMQANQAAAAPQLSDVWLNTAGLANGLYLVTVVTAQGRETLRLSVNH